MNPSIRQDQGPAGTLGQLRLQRGIGLGIILVAALLAFEIFNYSTTDFALTDLLGDLKFLGVRWATILSIAFCGIDFAGIARLFTPEEGEGPPREVWYLFVAWLLAATMNAMLTWWGVSLAILNHSTLGNSVIEQGTLLRVVPIFVAVLVWLIRVMIIGTFSAAGDRIFSTEGAPAYSTQRPVRNLERAAAQSSVSRRPAAYAPPPGRSSMAPPPRTAARPAPKPYPAREDPEEDREEQESSGGYVRPEPTYHPLAASGYRKSSAGESSQGGRYRKLNSAGRSRR